MQFDKSEMQRAIEQSNNDPDAQFTRDWECTMEKSKQFQSKRDEQEKAADDAEATEEMMILHAMEFSQAKKPEFSQAEKPAFSQDEKPAFSQDEKPEVVYSVDPKQVQAQLSILQAFLRTSRCKANCLLQENTSLKQEIQELKKQQWRCRGDEGEPRARFIVQFMSMFTVVFIVIGAIVASTPTTQQSKHKKD